MDGKSCNITLNCEFINNENQTFKKKINLTNLKARQVCWVELLSKYEKEIFNKEYFSSQISLSNNLSFICEINNIDINKFLEEHDLIEDLNSNKSKKRKEIQIDTYNKIMFYFMKKKTCLKSQ